MAHFRSDADYRPRLAKRDLPARALRILAAIVAVEVVALAMVVLS